MEEGEREREKYRKGGRKEGEGDESRVEEKRKREGQSGSVLEELLKITCRDIPVPRTDFLRGYLFDIGSSEARHRNERKV